MSAVLRIEDTLRQIPPVSLIQNPSGSDIVLIPVFTYTDRNTMTLSDGRIQETFTIFGQAYRSYATPDLVRQKVRTLDRAFKQRFQESVGAVNSIFLVEATDGEELRRAFIHSASITPIDDAIIRSVLTNTTNSALYTLVLERGPWETTTRIYSRQNLSAIGGNARLSDTVTSGDVPGRITRLSISPTAGNQFRYVWMGIKPAYQDISDFDPQIEVKDSVIWKPGTDPATDTPSDAAAYTALASEPVVGDAGVIVPFKHPLDEAGNQARSAAYEDWKTRFGLRLYLWNSTTKALSEAGTDGARRIRQQWVGRYRVLLRWRSGGASGDQGQRYGIRLAAGYGRSQRQVIKEIYPSWNDKWHVADMGEIVIGDDLWSNQIAADVDLLHYHLFIAAKVVVPSSLSRTAFPYGSFPLIFDDMYLIPSAHMLRFSLDYDEASVEEEVIAYTNENESLVAFLKDKRSSDEIPGIRQKITDIEAVNWYMPPYEGSRLVVYTDRNDNISANKNFQSRVTNNAVKIDMNVNPRVKNYREAVS